MLDIMAKFTQNLSEIVIDEFGKDLPELYIPVVNKLWFRFYHLWIMASEQEIDEMSEQSEVNSTKYTKNVLFAKDRLLSNMWRLLERFKRKCLKHLLFTKQSNQQI